MNARLAVRGNKLRVLPQGRPESSLGSTKVGRWFQLSDMFIFPNFE
jgi:hypothetical protein